MCLIAYKVEINTMTKKRQIMRIKLYLYMYSTVTDMFSLNNHQIVRSPVLLSFVVIITLG